MKNITVRFAAALLALASFASNASLIINGGFEAPVLNKPWAHLSASAVPGWSTYNNQQIEIWGTQGPSFEGAQHLELNSNGNGPFSIWQDISTLDSVWYSLSFAANRRTDQSGPQEFKVLVFDANDLSNMILTSLVTSPNGWQVFSFRFQAASDLTRIQFTSVLPTGTMGNFIDDVSVVPAPGALMLMALSLLGIAIRRRV